MPGTLSVDVLKDKVSSFVKENGLDGVLILHNEGFPIVSYSLFYIDEERLSALLTSLFSSLEIDGEEFVFMEFNGGRILVSTLNSDFKLVLFASESIKLNRLIPLFKDLKLDLQQAIDS